MEAEQRQVWVLVTGGTGYIGSIVTVELCARGYNVIVADQPSAASARVVQGMRDAVAQAETDVGQLLFTYCDLSKDVLHIPRACDVIIHLAAYKSVAESTADPLKYYDNNLKCLLTVLDCARRWRNRPQFIFSSSATVYGTPEVLPITEAHPLRPVNAYGQSKLMCEQILQGLCAPDASNTPISSAVCLRYFNPVGAHTSGMLGERCAQPTNLMPILCEAAAARRDCVYVFSGEDAPASPIRDYLHVMDLAEAHIAAIAARHTRFEAINLGRGHGVSVMEMIHAMEVATGKSIPTEMAPKRPGDVWTIYTSCDKAQRVLGGWHAHRSVQEMCESAWNFYRKQ